MSFHHLEFAPNLWPYHFPFDFYFSVIFDVLLDIHPWKEWILFHH